MRRWGGGGGSFTFNARVTRTTTHYIFCFIFFFLSKNHHRIFFSSAPPPSPGLVKLLQGEDLPFLEKKEKMRERERGLPIYLIAFSGRERFNPIKRSPLRSKAITISMPDLSPPLVRYRNRQLRFLNTHKSNATHTQKKLGHPPPRVFVPATAHNNQPNLSVN